MFKYKQMLSLQFHSDISSLELYTKHTKQFHTEWTQHLPFIADGSTVYLRINFTWSWWGPHSCRISSGRSSSRRTRSVKQTIFIIKSDIRKFWDKRNRNKFYAANQRLKYSVFLRCDAVRLADRCHEFRTIVVSLKRLEHPTHQPTVVHKRAGIVSSTAVRTWNVAGL